MSEKVYPSVRHHADGIQTIKVKSAEHELQLQSDQPNTWFETPRPRPVAPPPKPLVSMAELDSKVSRHEDQITALTESNDRLVTSNAELNELITELITSVEELKAHKAKK